MSSTQATANQTENKQDEVDLDGPPLVLGNPAFTDVTDKVAEIIEKKTPPGWLIMLTFAISMLAGVVACPSLMFGTVPDDDVIEAAVDAVLRGFGSAGTA